MKEMVSISEQLKQRRLDCGLSLSELARRADTSPATLSRYENGWTRFETSTLRKLAMALGCELRVDLVPFEARSPGKMTRTEAIKRLQRLFWDSDLNEDELENHPVWVVERMLEYGNLEDTMILQVLMGRHRFLETVSLSRLSPKTREFWNQMLKKEGMPCTKRSYRNEY
jgi:transcriptional regulator with XRE-family HTH domain